MSAPHGVLSLKGDFKRAFDCDIQAVKIAAKAQEADRKQEVANAAVAINPEELQIPSKKPSLLAPPKEVDVKHIDLGTSDPTKIAIISAHLSAK